MSNVEWGIVIPLSVLTAVLVWTAVGTKRMEAGVRKVLGYTDKADK